MLFALCETPSYQHEAYMSSNTVLVKLCDVSEFTKTIHICARFIAVHLGVRCKKLFIGD
jgi:hypothetical protein